MGSVGLISTSLPGRPARRRCRSAPPGPRFAGRSCPSRRSTRSSGRRARRPAALLQLARRPLRDPAHRSPSASLPPRAQVLDAVVEHAKLTEMQPLWAVTPLRGQNDSAVDAAALADLAKRFEALTDGIRPRISVIPYNCARVPELSSAFAI